MTDRDIVLRPVAQHPERLESRCVADVMSRDVLVAYENEDLHEVLHSDLTRLIVNEQRPKPDQGTRAYAPERAMAR